MKKLLSILLTAALALSLAACAGQSAPSESSSTTPTAAPEATTEPAAEPTAAPEATDAPSEAQSNILIAYFTRLNNTDATLEEILQGGGPYGAISDDDIDSMTTASITMVNGEATGNVETLARMIQSEVGGDLFSIETETAYPVDYNALIDAGNNENNENARPALTTQVENMDDYDIVFIGFPNWWYDMPMAVYSFLEAYDFSGKTVIPFASSAGSGFSGAIGTMTEMLPTANVVQDGLHVEMGSVGSAAETVAEWTAGLDIVETAAEAPAAVTTGTYPDGSTPTLSGRHLRLTVNGTDEVVIALYDNSAVDAFLERMPMDGVEFYDLSGVEKPARTPDEPFSIAEETPGYDPVAGEMVIYRPWGNFTIFYGDFRHSDELVPLGIVESGLEILANQQQDFTGDMVVSD